MRVFTLIVLGTLVNVSCEQQSQTKNDDSPVQHMNTDTVEKINCGNNAASVSLKITRPEIESNRFALLLAGSPVTNYFSEESQSAHELTEKLIKEGFAVAQVKYRQKGGFYGACGAQGIPSVVNHSGELYDVALKKLGADPNNPQHKIVGVGFSIGATQLQAMAFMLGKRIDRIALIGVLVGDVAQGCKSFLDGINDGYTWNQFHRLAMALTKNQKGCYPPSEYSSALNFENQPYADKWALGIFEGEIFGTSSIRSSGNIDQAKYIESKRKEVGAPVSLYTYPQCGHEVLRCSQGQAGKDIVDFVTRDRDSIIKKLFRLLGF